MKVEVEQQPGSVSKLQIELPADEVAKEWNAIANSFARFAKIPGYRPGKAPRAVIDKRFRKEIQDELTKKLVSKSYHEAVEQEHLRVVSLTKPRASALVRLLRNNFSRRVSWSVRPGFPCGIFCRSRHAALCPAGIRGFSQIARSCLRSHPTPFRLPQAAIRSGASRPNRAAFLLQPSL